MSVLKRGTPCRKRTLDQWSAIQWKQCESYRPKLVFCICIIMLYVCLHLPFVCLFLCVLLLLFWRIKMNILISKAGSTLGMHAGCIHTIVDVLHFAASTPECIGLGLVKIHREWYVCLTRSPLATLRTLRIIVHVLIALLCLSFSSFLLVSVLCIRFL